MAIDEANSGLLEDAEELNLTALNECNDCEIIYSDDNDTEANATPVNAAETLSKWALKGRLKSWALWVSVLGAVGIILDNIGIFARFGLDGDKWTLIINAVGGILVAFGILNDPTNPVGF